MRARHPQTHTLSKPAYDHLVIDNQEKVKDYSKARCRYIELSLTTDLEEVSNFLSSKWKLPAPKLLISIIGGSKWPKARQATGFKRELIKAAKATGAWIITTAGDMQLFDETAGDHNITMGRYEKPVVLSIASLGRLNNEHALDGDEDHGLFKIRYPLEKEEETSNAKNVPLVHNLTHLILVDDGKEIGKEIEFRNQLVKYLSETTKSPVTESQNSGENIPVINLVVNGKLNTMRTVLQAVHDDNPVVVFDGSGGAADFIAKGNRKNKYSHNTFSDDSDEDADVKPFGEEFNETEVDKMNTLLEDILEKKQLVEIRSLSWLDADEIIDSILGAFLKANQVSPCDLLSLAVACNNETKAGEVLETKDEIYWQNNVPYDVFVTALVQDKYEYVDLFKDHGLKLTKFISLSTLSDLYEYALQDRFDLTSQLIQDKLKYFKDRLKSSRSSCFKNTEDINEDRGRLTLLSVGKFIAYLLKDAAMNPYQEFDSMSSRKGTSFDLDTFPERDLLYWAIIFDRWKIAKNFWKDGQNQIGSALVACSMLKATSDLASDDGELELSRGLQVHAGWSEKMANDVILKCYFKRKKMAQKLLVRKLELFGGTTLFRLADTNTLMKFMGQTCCQTKLNLIWKGNMAVNTPNWKILLCFVIYPVMIWFIKFKKENDDEFDDEFDEFEEVSHDNPKKKSRDLPDKIKPEDDSKQKMNEQAGTEEIAVDNQKKKVSGLQERNTKLDDNLKQKVFNEIGRAHV